MIKINDDLFNAVQNKIITEEPSISVDICSGPMGSYGSRSGNWTVTIDGIKFLLYSSISHRLPLDEQKNELIIDVKQKIYNMTIGIEHAKKEGKESFDNEKYKIKRRKENE